MDLIPNVDQQQISDLAADFMQNELPLSRFHDGAEMPIGPLRTMMAEMGWLAISLPEEAGGAGFGPVEEVLILRQLGRVVGPTFMVSSLLGAKFADAQQLPGVRDDIAGGRRGVALAIAEAPLAVGPGGIAGRATVYDAADADYALAFAGGEAFLLGMEGARITPVPWLDAATSVAHLDLNDLPVVARGVGEALFLNGALLTAAMLTGLAEGAVSMIQDYAKVRETFGRKIGAYQAVRHPIAEGAARSEHAKALLHYSALAFAASRADAELQVRSAKLIAHRAASRNADINIQLHGGIGITEELAAHRFMKRALMLSHWFGGRKEHLDALLDAPLLTI